MRRLIKPNRHLRCEMKTSQWNVTADLNADSVVFGDGVTLGGFVVCQCSKLCLEGTG